MATSHWHQLTVKEHPRYDADVVALQKALNRADRVLKTGRVPVDGKFGAVTLAKSRKVGYFYGAPDAQIARGRPVSVWLQKLIRAPWTIYAKDANTRRRGTARIAARRRHLSNWRDWGMRQLAQYIVDSPNVRWSTWLSTGSDEARFRELARYGKCRVPHFPGRWVTPDIDILRFIVHVAHLGHTIEVTALTGGVHSWDGSHHYYGTALDDSIAYGQWGEQGVARGHGLIRNFETNHRHYDA